MKNHTITTADIGSREPIESIADENGEVALMLIVDQSVVYMAPFITSAGK